MHEGYPKGVEMDAQNIKAVLDTIPNEQYAVGYVDPVGKAGYRNPVREVVGEGLTDVIRNLQTQEDKQLVGVELGTALGRSGLHMALGGLNVLHTVEFDRDAAKTARRNFAAAGLRGFTVYNQDSGEFCEAYKDEPIDVLFIDHAKERYLPDFQSLERKLSPNALVLMDNSFNRAGECKDAVAYVADHYLSAIFTEPSTGGETTGLLVASKSRDVFDLTLSTLISTRERYAS